MLTFAHFDRRLPPLVPFSRAATAGCGCASCRDPEARRRDAVTWRKMNSVYRIQQTFIYIYIDIDIDIDEQSIYFIYIYLDEQCVYIYIYIYMNSVYIYI